MPRNADNAPVSFPRGEHRPGASHARDNVCIGADTIIQAGSRIGNNVQINSASVIGSEIPDDTFVEGVPARPVRGVEALRRRITPARLVGVRPRNAPNV
jgi:serine acetyltransferase